MDVPSMVNDMMTHFLWGFVRPLPFFFVLMLVRQCKKYFLDASDIELE